MKSINKKAKKRHISVIRSENDKIKSTKNKKSKKRIKTLEDEIHIIKSSLNDQDLDFILNDYPIEDSRQESKRCFEILINPITSDEFTENFLEKKIFHIQRNNSLFERIFSTKILDEILKNNIIKFTENLDVVQYVNDKRETLNESGRANASLVWQYFNEGYSIRLLNPQTYCKPVWKMLSLLQEHFLCMAGANVYLTPAGTQGFAPHWDDIDAFVLQLEGRKKWRVYAPRSIEETLPLYSSENFTDEDIGLPIFENVLDPGDLLYFPRGYIHQACSLEDSHSLHITISINQKNTWTDFLHNLLPRALDIAAEENIEFRKSLPINYLNYVGVMYSELCANSEIKTSTELENEKNSNEKLQSKLQSDNVSSSIGIQEHRNMFQKTLYKLLNEVMSVLPIDATADQMFKNYLSSTLPPCLSSEELNKRMVSFLPNFRKQNLSSIKSLNDIDSKQSNSDCNHNEYVGINKKHFMNGNNEQSSIKGDTKVKLVRANILRIVSEDKIFLHHNLDNSRVYEGNESLPIEMTVEEADCIELLIRSYPKYLTIAELNLENLKENIKFVKMLGSRGLLFAVNR